MPGRSRLAVARVAFLTAILLGALGSPGPVLAQGQESETSAMGSQSKAHPPPLLSTADVTSVPSGQTIDGLPLPAALRRDGERPGLAMPGEVPLRSPAKLDCAAIGDPTARERCAARTSPPPPPKGAG